MGARNIAGFNAKVAEYNAQSEIEASAPSIDRGHLSTSWQI